MIVELYGVSYAEAEAFFYEENQLPKGTEDDFSLDDGGYVDADAGDYRRYVVIEYTGDIYLEDEVFEMIEELSDEYGGEIYDY
jgi:hypothetical protein